MAAVMALQNGWGGDDSRPVAESLNFKGNAGNS
jgi:hypothetical protein